MGRHPRPDVDAVATPRAGPVTRARPGLEPNATLVQRFDLTPTVARFVVRPDAGVPPFEPGQYFALGLTVDGRPLQRPYSTSSPRGEATSLEFLVRLVGAGAFTPRLWRLAADDRLWIGRPKGLFMLRPDDRRTHLFVATGTGLAPFVSMLETIVGTAGGPQDDRPGLRSPRAVVVHGVAHVAELAYRDRLERLAGGADGVRYSPVVSRPTHPDNDGWSGLTGRLVTRLDEVCSVHRVDPDTSVAYLCGNPEMIASAERVLLDRGFAPDAVISEHYWPLA